MRQRKLGVRQLVRGLATAALACALALAPLAPATVALAEGSITVNAAAGNGQSFTAYQIFTGTVSDGDSGKTIKGVAWKDDTTKTAVENFLKSSDNGASSTYSGTSASDAATYIASNIQNTDASTVVAGDSFAAKLAAAVKAASLTGTTLTSGTAATLADGWWLIVSAAPSGAQLATSPIFAVVGDAEVTVTEKTSLPTLTKAAAGKAALSAAVSEQLTYTLTGTLPSNYAGYASYAYTFTDAIPAGITVDTSSVKVTVGSTDITTSATVTNANGNLTVAISDLKAAASTATSAPQVVVTYNASLNASAVAGSAGNAGAATITYSADPLNPSTTATSVANPATSASTPAAKTNVFTYGLNLKVVDLDSEEVLSGAKFTIRDANNQYVEADGSRSTAEVQLDATSGTLSLPRGLKAGTYTVAQVAAPTGHNSAQGFTFTVGETYSATGELALTGLTASVSATDGSVVAGDSDGTTTDGKLVAKGSPANVGTGIVTITVGNASEARMPLTGQQGIILTFVAGAVVIALTIRYARSKRNQS